MSRLRLVVSNRQYIRSDLIEAHRSHGPIDTFLNK